MSLPLHINVSHAQNPPGRFLQHVARYPNKGYLQPKNENALELRPSGMDAVSLGEGYRRFKETLKVKQSKKTPKMKALRPFEPHGTTHPTLHHMLEGLNPQLTAVKIKSRNKMPD